MQFYWSKLVKIIKNYTRDDTTTEGKARIMQINNLDNLIQQLALKSTSFQTSNQHPFKQKNTRVREKNTTTVAHMQKIQYLCAFFGEVWTLFEETKTTKT